MEITLYAKNIRQPYGVFIGADHLDYQAMGRYDVVVIDAEYFSAKQIEKLKKSGCKQVYSYLNVGALESFREYYDDYKDITLQKYENWDEEYWVDVSNDRWQKFCVSRGNKLYAKGIDGLFIDNCDVYYFFPQDDIFKGLITILRQLHKKGKIIINGGDTFVSKCILRKHTGLFDGVNQESVYTRIDFTKKKFYKAPSEDRKYYTDYLKKVGGLKKKVYVLEYSNAPNLTKKGQQYAKKRGWTVYISPSLELNTINIKNNSYYTLDKMGFVD